MTRPVTAQQAAREAEALSRERLRQERAMGPDYSRTGIFVDHNCWRCQSGKLPCVQRSPSQCEHPHARND